LAWGKISKKILPHLNGEALIKYSSPKERT